jgi:hypothetical protein
MMTPKDARKAEREKLQELDYQFKERTEAIMMLDMVDRFVMAVEKIADAMTAPKPMAAGIGYPPGCVCPAGAEIGCGSSGCPRRSFRGVTSTC